jgi:hypothetical protein
MKNFVEAHVPGAVLRASALQAQAGVSVLRHLCAAGTRTGQMTQAAGAGEIQGKKKPATHGGGRHRYSIQKIGTGEYYT